jgi:LacI family transcriptional regulator
MKDIADRAGVSRSAASFVLNDSPLAQRISLTTRQRVLDAARELGYMRNELARAVAVGRTFVLGYVKGGVSEQDSRILDGILQESAEHGYVVKVLSSHCPGGYTDVTRRCVEQRLAGLIVRRIYRSSSGLSNEEFSALTLDLRSHHIPVVFVDDNIPNDGATFITSDDVQGYRLAVEHLIGLGHRRIVFIVGTTQKMQGTQRSNTFRAVLKEHGCPVPDNAVVECQWSVERAEELTRELFANGNRDFTGVICDGDTFAAGVMRTLRKIGLRVPEDVSVVGYANFAFSALLDPPLTTVAQPFEAMGTHAVQCILKQIQCNNASDSEISAVAPPELLPTELVIRASTAQAAYSS